MEMVIRTHTLSYAVVKIHLNVAPEWGVRGGRLRGNLIPSQSGRQLLHLSSLHANRRDIITCCRWCNSLRVHQLLSYRCCWEWQKFWISLGWFRKCGDVFFSQMDMWRYLSIYCTAANIQQWLSDSSKSSAAGLESVTRPKTKQSFTSLILLLCSTLHYSSTTTGGQSGTESQLSLLTTASQWCDSRSLVF